MRVADLPSLATPSSSVLLPPSVACPSSKALTGKCYTARTNKPFTHLSLKAHKTLFLRILSTYDKTPNRRPFDPPYTVRLPFSADIKCDSTQAWGACRGSTRPTTTQRYQLQTFGKTPLSTLTLREHTTQDYRF